MSDCCNGNNGEVLNILMGYAENSSLITKSLWWITRKSSSKKYTVYVVDDGECGDLESSLRNYSIRTKYKIIKINNNKLKDYFGISSLKESRNLGFAICEKFSEKRKVFISPRTLCFPFNFDDFVSNMNEEEIIKMNTYLIPKYVQPALSEDAANFCNFLAKECKKHPINTNLFPPLTSDYVTKAYYDESKNKIEKFLEYDCFYIEPENEVLSDKIENIDFDLIDKILD